MQTFLEYLLEAKNNSEKNVLGQVVTELFPCLYFLAGRAISENSTEFPKDVWKKIKSECLLSKPNSPFYLMGASNEKVKKYSNIDGLNSIWNGYSSSEAESSTGSKMKDKLLQAEQIYHSIKDLQKSTKGKSLVAVQWGDQCQPEGIPANEADIYLKWSDGSYTGISLKATKSKSGSVSLKNRTLSTWTQAIVGDDAKAAEIVDTIQKAVYKAYPRDIRKEFNSIYDANKTLSSKEVSSEVEKVCKWISSTSQAKLASVESTIKTTLNTAFADEMNKCTKDLSLFKDGLVRAMVDERKASSKMYTLLVWKASNTGVNDLTERNIIDKVRMAESIQFQANGLSGAKMNIINNGIAKSYNIDIRQSHELHNSKIDLLLQNTDLSELNDTFTATLFKGVATSQVMAKLKSE